MGRRRSGQQVGEYLKTYAARSGRQSRHPDHGKYLVPTSTPTSVRSAARSRCGSIVHNPATKATPCCSSASIAAWMRTPIQWWPRKESALNLNLPGPGAPHQRQSPALDRHQRGLGFRRAVGRQATQPDHNGHARLQRSGVESIPAHLSSRPRQPRRQIRAPCWPRARSPTLSPRHPPERALPGR